MSQPAAFKDTVLREALGLIESDRQEQYGPPDENFGRWSHICEALGFHLTPGDLALIMAAGKLARIGNRRMTLPNGSWAIKRDNLVDLPGYCSLAAHLYGDRVV